jgi:hypothetical protein
MAKSKEQKRKEAIERFRKLFSEKMTEYHSCLPGGSIYSNDAIKGASKEYLEELGTEAKRKWELYLDMAQIDSHGNPVDKLPKFSGGFRHGELIIHSAISDPRKMTPLILDQNEIMESPASFYTIDQMASYRSISKTKQLEPSYDLEEILGKESKGLDKLKLEYQSTLSGTDQRTRELTSRGMFGAKAIYSPDDPRYAKMFTPSGHQNPNTDEFELPSSDIVTPNNLK